MLRALLNQRLSAAVEEIFVMLERTIAEYEEELCRTREENVRQRQMLDAVFRPQAEILGAGLSSCPLACAGNYGSLVKSNIRELKSISSVRIHSINLKEGFEKQI